MKKKGLLFGLLVLAMGSMLITACAGSAEAATLDAEEAADWTQEVAQVESTPVPEAETPTEEPFVSQASNVTEIQDFYVNLTEGTNLVSNGGDTIDGKKYDEKVYIIEKYVYPNGGFGLVIYKAEKSVEYDALGNPIKEGYVRGEKVSKQEFEADYVNWHYVLDNPTVSSVDVPAH